MDILQYQEDRTSELTEFEKEYSDLKAEYMSLLSDAIYEKDPEKQALMVKMVLQLNSDLSGHVKSFIGSIGKKKYASTTVEDLTKEIIEYQEEHTSLEKATDEVQTLKDILATRKDSLKSVKYEYNILLAILLVAIVVVLFMIMRSSMPTLPSPAGGSLLKHLQ